MLDKRLRMVKGGQNGGRSSKNDAIHRERSSRKRDLKFRELWKERKRAPRRPADDGKRAGGAVDKDITGEPDWGSRDLLRKDRETRRRYLRHYYTWLRPFWPRLVGLTLLGLLISVLDLFWPWAGGRMLDVVTTEAWREHLPAWLPLAEMDKEGWLLTLGFSALAVIFVSRFLGLARNLAMRTLNAQVTFRLRRQLFQHIVRLPLGDIHEMKSGGVISRLSSDVDNTIGLVQQAVLSPVAAIIRLILTAIVLFMISWQITLAAMILLMGCGLVYNYRLRTVRPIYRSMGEDRARIDGRVAETFGGLRVVRAFAREQKEELEYAIGHHTAIRKQLWAHAIQQFLHLFWELLMPLTTLVIMGLGCWLVLRGQLTPGSILTIQMLALQVLNPVFMIVNSMTETQRSLAAMERVYEVLERPQEKPDRPGALPPPQRIEEIRFEGLSFAYGYESEDGSDVNLEGATLVLKDINLVVPGSSMVAFVGPSGAGKTTLTDLIARYHDPSLGRILVNGRDLRDYRLRAYRTRLSIVQQETFLFDGTVRENIAYSRRNVTDTEVIDAAKRAHAWEFIVNLPEGLDTLVGERGVKLSGGQRQRLSIARAILANPAILILDEATSNLDTYSEQLVQEAMNALFVGHTTFVVAHRLSTIQNADIIAVLKDGRIIQCGNHDQLMALGEGTTYYDMVMRQRTRDSFAAGGRATAGAQP